MRPRSLRKPEEMEIRGEHDALTKERKDLASLMGSEKLKSERLIEELRAVDAQVSASRPQMGQTPHPDRSRRPMSRNCRRRPTMSKERATRCGARAHHRGLFAEGMAAR